MEDLKKRIADVLFFQSPAFTKKRQPCYRSEFDPIAGKVIWAIEASGCVTVDRARFERVLDVAESAYAYTNSPYPSGECDSAESRQTKAVDALQPGDLDPLP